MSPQGIVEIGSSNRAFGYRTVLSTTGGELVVRACSVLREEVYHMMRTVTVGPLIT